MVGFLIKRTKKEVEDTKEDLGDTPYRNGKRKRVTNEKRERGRGFKYVKGFLKETFWWKRWIF